MVTKPKGIHATFAYACVTCGAECTVTNSRVDPHTCRVEITHYQKTTLADLDAALDNR